MLSYLPHYWLLRNHYAVQEQKLALLLLAGIKGVFAQQGRRVYRGIERACSRPLVLVQGSAEWQAVLGPCT